MTLIKTIPKLKSELKGVVDAVEKARNILLVSASNPDADSVGTMVALTEYCKQKSKNTFGFCIADMPESLNFLDVPKLINDENDIPNSIDTVIMFDLGNLSMTGLTDWLDKCKPTIINIDHHKTNNSFGDINVVHTNAAAASELAYNLFLYDKIPIPKQVATALLAGLITDTGNLTNPATSPTAVAMASHLVTLGGNLMKVLQHTFKNKSVNALKLWGEVMENLHHCEEWNMTIAIVTRDHYQKYNADDEWIEGLANFLTILGEANAIMVLRQKDDSNIKGSMRTTRDDIDLEKLARTLGGGGHKKASGFTIEGNLVKKENAWYIS